MDKTLLKNLGLWMMSVFFLMSLFILSAWKTVAQEPTLYADETMDEISCWKIGRVVIWAVSKDVEKIRLKISRPATIKLTTDMNYVDWAELITEQMDAETYFTFVAVVDKIPLPDDGIVLDFAIDGEVSESDIAIMNNSYVQYIDQDKSSPKQLQIEYKLLDKECQNALINKDDFQLIMMAENTVEVMIPAWLDLSQIEFMIDKVPYIVWDEMLKVNWNIVTIKPIVTLPLWEEISLSVNSKESDEVIYSMSQDVKENGISAPTDSLDEMIWWMMDNWSLDDSTIEKTAELTWPECDMLYQFENEVIDIHKSKIFDMRQKLNCATPWYEPTIVSFNWTHSSASFDEIASTQTSFFTRIMTYFWWFAFLLMLVLYLQQKIEKRNLIEHAKIDNDTLSTPFVQQWIDTINSSTTNPTATAVVTTATTPNMAAHEDVFTHTESYQNTPSNDDINQWWDNNKQAKNWREAA